MDEADVARKAARERALQFINERFENLESLTKSPELFEEFTATKANLEKQLSFATKEVPMKINSAIRDADVAAKSITRLHTEQDQLVGDIFSHVAENTSMVNRMSQTTAQIRELEKYSQYLSCISHFEDLSSDIQSALLIKSIERSIIQFAYMADLAKDLETSNCTHLVKFVNDTVVFWYKILSEKLASEFDECLRAWQWPFIVTSVKSLPIVNPTEQKEKLGSLFALLAKLQLSDSFQAEGDKSQGNGFMSKLPGWRPMLLPLQMLLKPFQKRFVFHFYGNKKTNNLDKPEWYFTQTLSWIRDHMDFLKAKIQPELDNAGAGPLDATVEFSRGLVALAADKLYKDLPQLLAVDERFAHIVDETLAFHRELYRIYDYPDGQPSCLHVLMQPDAFRRWLHIEKQCALQKMDSMLSSPTAWSSQYRDITDVDDLKVSECGESFMMLLLTITDRYKLLPSMAHRMDFLKLQLELLDDFRIRLLQVKKEILANKTDHLNQQYCAILNTVNYISDILCQWANLPFFVGLHYYKLHGGEKNFDAISEKPDEAVLGRLDSSLFDELINLFELMQKDMLANILSFVTDDVRARSRPYRHDRWLALPSQKDYVSMALSASACEMLLVLKDHLHCVETLLSKSLFSTFWQQLASNLNHFVYNEVILRNSFNEGGAVQLQFDMTRNLFPMFGDYTSKPENYFKDVKEACIALTLSSGSALLIKDVIYRALHEARTHRGTQLTDPIAALHDIGIYKLTLEEVELLLSLRIDLAT